jgi:DNA repair exonuclease SbcCD nuclease subunit
MSKLIALGDLHLTDQHGSGGLAKYVEKPDEYVMSEVSRVVKWGLKHDVLDYVFEGDICENPRMSYEAQLAFARCLRRYPDLQFWLIPGNHDKVGRDSAEGHSLEIIKEMRIKNLKICLTDEVVQIGRTKVKMCPWPSTAFDPKMLNIGHVEVRGSKTDSGRKMEGEELSKSQAVVLMGHLHTPHKVRNTHYTGTLYQTNFGEPLPKGFHYVEWTSRDDHEITHVPFDPKYKLHNCVIESEDDIKALPRSETDLIKLVVKDGADVVVPQWSNIVVTKVFKTKNDLVSILTEDLLNGHELVIRSSDYFNKWLGAQTIPQALKVRATRLRKQILGGGK